MAAGKIKKIVLEKGYGFIEPSDGGSDIFFHHSAVKDISIEDLGVGDEVTYDTEAGQGGKGPRATNVTRAS